jgi:hypothetical protein
MEKKASNYLPILLMLIFCGLRAEALSAFDLELNDAVQKKDWPTVVLLLQPKKGQNFEHDLTLAKALLSLERRQEAQKLLVSLEETHQDDRGNRLLQSAGTIFFNQDTSNLYYEALELIRGLKFADAKDRLEQGLSKEPNQVLLLTRLIQMDLLLDKKDQAATNLKLAQSLTLNLPVLKLFAAKLETDEQVAAHASDDPDSADNRDSDAEPDPDLSQVFLPIKSQLLENEVTAPFWFAALKLAGKKADLETLSQKTLKDHPLWTVALLWIYQNANVSPELKAKLEIQVEKNLKNKDQFEHALDLEMKRSNEFWVGYASFEALNAQWAKLHPKSPAH